MSNGARDALTDAIANLYARFARYPIDDLAGCPHCVSGADIECVKGVPLRELTAERLARYAFKAMTTWGTERDYKHFLPRIVELATMDVRARSYPGFDCALVLRKIAAAGFAAWPDIERVAIERVVRAWWDEWLHGSKDGIDLGNFVEGVAALGIGAGWLVTTWSDDRARAATIAIAEYLRAHGAWNPHAARDPFADHEPGVRDAFTSWLASDDVFERLNAEYFADADAPDAELLAAAIDGLRPP